MVPTTRRHLLSAAATTLAAGLAGCDGSWNGEREDPPDSHRLPNVERDPGYVTLRSGDDGPLLWTVSEATGVGSETETPPRHAGGRELIASESDAARLRFADVDGAADARQFVDETDFDEATLYVESLRVEACRKLELCHVAWSRGEVEIHTGEYYRDADASCEADARERALMLIRIPDALDPDEVNRHGSGHHSGGCRVPHWERDDRTEPTPGDVGPITDGDRREESDDE